MGKADRPPSLSEIAAMPGREWVALLRERISDIALAEGEDALPELARVIRRAERVVTNTLSGGLSNIVVQSSSHEETHAMLEEAHAIQSAMVRIGAPRMAEVLQRACDLVATAPTSAWDESDDDNDDGSPEQRALAALEKEFRNIGFDEPDSAVRQFIWRHRNNFGAS